MEYIENQTFDEIKVGDEASLVRTLSWQDIELFAVMSGDVNPAHLDQEYARSDIFHKIIAHGMWGGSLISTLLGTKLPGPGTIYLSQTLRFQRPVAIEDTITIKVKVVSKDEASHQIMLDCTCVNQKSETVISGCAEVIAPTEKVKRPRIVLPEVLLHEHGVRFKALIEQTKSLEPIRVAVVHPVDRDVLVSVLDAVQSELILPVLVGPENRIRETAEAAGVDLSDCQILPTEHSQAAAIEAVALARAGKVDALMRGSVRTAELMQSVVARETGLRTERRLSHVLMLDVPGYSRTLFLTDAILNTYPNLNDKRDIIQNAIDLVRALGIETPKVAILAAVSTINPKIHSTLDAAVLSKMVERGQIRGAIVDGPIPFDVAVSKEASLSGGTVSPVAGRADILIVPDLDTGGMLVKQLAYMAEAKSAGIVMGGRVPIVQNSRDDSALARMAGCAMALMVVQQKRAGKP